MSRRLVGTSEGLEDWNIEKSLPPPEIETRFLGCPAVSVVNILTELSWFQRQQSQQNNIDLEDTLGLFMM